MQFMEDGNVNSWTIKRIANPYPRQWPGRWFSFRSWKGEGQANERMIKAYLPECIYKQFQKHFRV